MSSKYIELLEEYKKLHAKEEKKINLIIWLRTCFGSTGILSIYLIFQNFKIQWMVLLSFSILIFINLIKIHQSLIENEKTLSFLKRINEDEYKYVKDNYLPFGSGKEFISPLSSLITDLNVFGENSLFQHINRTETFMGKERLAKIFMEGLEINQIRLYNQAVEELKTQLTWCQKFRAVAKLHPDNQDYYLRLVGWNNTPSSSLEGFNRIYFFITPILLTIFCCLFIANRNQTFFLLSCALFIVNLLILLLNYKNIKEELLLGEKIYKSIEKYSKLIRLIELEEFNTTWLRDLKLNLISNETKASKSVMRLARTLDNLETINNPWGLILLNGFFLYHLHILFSLLQWKTKHSNSLKTFLITVGEFDALISLANFVFNNPDFKYPKINNQGELVLKDLSHPLIKKKFRVHSNISFKNKKIVLLTGSNMSGKSTFLRSLGINIVLAKAGLPICASEANIFPFEILSFMTKKDSLQKNESYFFAELKSLKLIIDRLKEGTKCLVLLDEILRGTNSNDKRTGTILIIEKLLNLNAIGVIATHDLEVCELSNKYPNSLENKCFEVEILNDELIFDYQLRDGICKNTTASLLMKKIGLVD